MKIDLLGRAVPVAVMKEVTGAEWEVVGPRIVRMAEGTDAFGNSLTGDEIANFNLVAQITIFKIVEFGPFLMARSFMDVEKSIFYWSVEDMISDGYSRINRVPSYYYHDAFHIRQWLDGNRATNLDARVDREIEATDRQIIIAEKMNADNAFLEFLSDYRSNRAAIEARLKVGVGVFSSIFGRGDLYMDHTPMLVLDTDPLVSEPPKITPLLLEKSTTLDPWVM